MQGVQRFSIKRVLKERPFFEAEVVLHEKGKIRLCLMVTYFQAL